MANQNTKSQIGVYGVNFLTPSAVGFLKNVPKIPEVIKNLPGLDHLASSANPYGAMTFGALNLLKGLSNRMKNSRFTRLSEIVGAGFYAVSSVMDLFSIAEGDYTSAIDFAFNASMAYQLGRNTVENYETHDLLDDLTR